MPLTAKGEEILKQMEREYGEAKGKEVFYASRNAGKVTGVDEQTQDPLKGLAAAFDIAGVAAVCEAYDARHR